MKVQVLRASLIGLILAGCSSVEPEELPVRRNVPPEQQIVPDVVYGHKFGMALTFDLYRPTQPNGAGVVYLNSGGYRSPFVEFHTQENGQPRLLPDSEQPRMFNVRALLDDGFTVFNVRHGSSPKFVLSEVVDDVRRAVRFIRTAAPDYGVEPDRIGLWGGSAGGHLALLLGTAPEVGPEEPADEIDGAPAPVAAVVAYFPMSDIATEIQSASVWAQQTQGEDLLTVFPALNIPAELYGELSPVRFATAGDPPTLIIHGDQDPLVPIAQGELMRDALVSADAISELIVVEGAAHGFQNDDADFAVAQSLAWFQRHLQ